MQEVVIKIKAIEEHYAKACYLEAYQELHQLCSNHSQCVEFASAAASILSRFNDLNKSIMHGLIDLSQQETKKGEIRLSYDLLTKQMKTYFHPEKIPCYEEQAFRMRENRNALRNTLHTIEDDLENCESEVKSGLLRSIHEQLKEVIRYFGDLIKNFKAIQNYE